MNGEKEYPCFGMAFTNVENLMDYLKENEIDLLLLGEQMEKTGLEEEKIVWLTEQEETFFGALYKYQAGERLLERILQEIVKGKEEGRIERGDLNSFSKTSYRVYGVYSPVGRCGKTNLAKALCEYREGNSLYIGFEEYGSFPEDIEISQELLYYMKNRDEGIHLRLKQFAVRENHCYLIPSPCCYLDLKLLEFDDIRWFLERLKEEGSYQTIVFDIGVGSLLDFQIFSLFDRIFVPTLEEERAKQKEKHFLTYVKEKQNYEWQGNLCFSSVPNMEYDSLKMEEYVLNLVREE